MENLPFLGCILYTELSVWSWLKANWQHRTYHGVSLCGWLVSSWEDRRKSTAFRQDREATKHSCRPQALCPAGEGLLNYKLISQSMHVLFTKPKVRTLVCKQRNQKPCVFVNISNPFIRESYMMLKMFPDISANFRLFWNPFGLCTV